MSGSLSEDSAEAKKLPDKTRTHAFILELEQGSQEALKQRSVGKFDRLPRKELHSKERREKERSVSDERAKLKSKQADDSQQRDGAALKVSPEEKSEKKPKIKSEKKTAGAARDGKPSVSEGAAEEAAVKKAKVPSVENVRVEKEKEKSREREKEKSKEKAKGEKTSAKGDFKQTPRHESVSLFDDRADVDPVSDGGKKKEKHSKDVLKRSKSHGDDRPGDKGKKDGEREKTKTDQDGQKSNKSGSETDREPKKVKPTEKGKIAEKSKSKSKEETKTLSKMDSKAQGPQAKSAGPAPAAKEKKKDTKEPRKASEETQHDKSEVKSAKKKKEKEKRDGSQEEKKTREDKLEKLEKSPKPSAVAPVSLVAEEPAQKAAALHDDPVATTTTNAATAAATSLSDDTCDALSDITPEPPEGELESRLAEMSAVPGEADALLTLMDVCTSAEARLPPAPAQMSEREADMKMKEAALTLLSMDCGAVTSALVCQDVQGHQAEPPQPLPQPMEAETEEQEEEEEQEHHLPDEVTAAEPPAGPKQASVQPEAQEEANTAGTLMTTRDGRLYRCSPATLAQVSPSSQGE